MNHVIKKCLGPQLYFVISGVCYNRSSNHRNCFTNALKCGRSNIFESVKHRFQKHHTILHFANNDQIPEKLKTAQRFEAKLVNIRIEILVYLYCYKEWDIILFVQI